MLRPERNGPGTICHVLREDIGLCEAIPPGQRERAIEECIAAAVQLPRGGWRGMQSDSLSDGIGLLVLRGLLIRQVGLGGSSGAELLGEGDLLRPWPGEDAEPSLEHTTGWRVIEPTRVAVLDRRAAARFARYPELTGRFVSRALARSRNLAVNMAIVQQARVHVRLHMLFWHLANRWGYVRPEGVVLPLRLTHSVLAELVAARRPTVSTMLTRLSQEGLIVSQERGWLLPGNPPGELLELQDLSAPGGHAARTSELRPAES